VLDVLSTPILSVHGFLFRVFQTYCPILAKIRYVISANSTVQHLGVSGNRCIEVRIFNVAVNKIIFMGVQRSRVILRKPKDALVSSEYNVTGSSFICLWPGRVKILQV
jgi:hypothetical protein